ncbi:hypothetical protein [Saccharothrix sp. ALI-22-I]|nr:hypothetical protein [Saccharothrix sp. ALI-22-I]
MSRPSITYPLGTERTNPALAVRLRASGYGRVGACGDQVTS